MEQQVRTPGPGSLPEPKLLARGADDFLPCLCTFLRKRARDAVRILARLSTATLDQRLSVTWSTGRNFSDHVTYQASTSAHGIIRELPCSSSLRFIISHFKMKLIRAF